MPCNSRLDQNLLRQRWATVALFASAFVMTAQAQETPAAKDANAKQTQSGQHDGVLARGDHAMGFSHETTTHHFRLCKTGGVIEVLANDAKDSASRDQIRMHLAHIAKLFTAGDFNIPGFIHATTPPGAAMMSKLRERIRYEYADTDGGATIHITTANAEALQAIHAFLRFQITDHQTGDSTEISKQ